MTVDSIKNDIREAFPPKEVKKDFSWSSFMMNSEFGQFFSSLFDTYNIEELLEDYKQEIGEYE